MACGKVRRQTRKEKQSVQNEEWSMVVGTWWWVLHTDFRQPRCHAGCNFTCLQLAASQFVHKCSGCSPLAGLYLAAGVGPGLQPAAQRIAPLRGRRLQHLHHSQHLCRGRGAAFVCWGGRSRGVRGTHTSSRRVSMHAFSVQCCLVKSVGSAPEAHGSPGRSPS